MSVHWWYQLSVKLCIHNFYKLHRHTLKRRAFHSKHSSYKVRLAAIPKDCYDQENYTFRSCNTLLPSFYVPVVDSKTTYRNLDFQKFCYTKYCRKQHFFEPTWVVECFKYRRIKICFILAAFLVASTSILLTFGSRVLNVVCESSHHGSSIFSTQRMIYLRIQILNNSLLETVQWASSTQWTLMSPLYTITF